MPRLPALLSAAFPARTPDGQRILQAIAAVEGDVPTADELAVELGYDNRHQMARAMMRAGLPPLEHVSGWAMLLGWTARSEQDGITLCELAAEYKRDPAVCYRLTKRLTGKVWTEVVKLGTGWLVATVRQRYGYAPLTAAQVPTRRRSGDNERPLVKTSAPLP